MGDIENGADADAAIAWAVRTSDPNFDDWQAFARWSMQDPVRNELYDRAMAAAGDGTAVMAKAPFSIAPTRDQPRRLHAARRWSRNTMIAGTAGAGIAAAIAALLLLSPARLSPQPIVITAPPGKSRSLQLVDGSRVTIASRSRLTIDRTSPRRVVLNSGRAIFFVRHDAGAPFRVLAGRQILEDAGTVFEVVSHTDAIRIAVAEGAVIADPDKRPISLAAGQYAILPENGRARIVGRLPVDEIGMWRRERLSYHDTPLNRVADTLAAATGRRIYVAPDLAGRRFTGTLIPATFRDDPRALGDLLSVTVRSSKGDWTLHER